MSDARFMVAAASSGTGKTTLVCGLLRVLSRRGLRASALKCGPDYLDPTFHRRLSGARTGNLDSFFCDEPTVRALMARACATSDITVVEGVMGYYDGIMDGGTKASSYDVARITGTPCVLVVNARGTSLSAAAVVQGFASFRQDANIRGFILNRASAAVCGVVGPAVEHACGVKCLGYVPNNEAFGISSRHLGLVDADEVADLSERIDALADVLETTLDIDALLDIAGSSVALGNEPFAATPVTDAAPVIAVARDEAFSFYYSENLELLEELGARLAFFSPLLDEGLPKGTAGIYLGGGYPELHAAELEANASMRASLLAAVGDGMPVVAECGGFMYLQRELTDDAGRLHEMVGAIEGACKNEGRLRHFGYVDLTAASSGLLCDEGETLVAHEFHYWHSTHEGCAFAAKKPGRATAWEAGVHAPALYAGYPHLYWPANPEPARRFVRACAAFAGRGGRA